MAMGSRIGSVGLQKGKADADYVNVSGDTMTGRLDGYILVDTRDNILATTPASNTIALASDTGHFYVYDGSEWKISPLPMGIVSTGEDMGAFTFERDYGYGIADLSNKFLHNTVIRYNDKSQEGAIRYDTTNKKLEVYKNAAWRNVIIYSIAEENDLARWSKYTTYDNDAYSNDIIHENQTDMGAFASEHLITGGSF